ncbi:MAG TPA: signal peptide peptidase SppA [Candidatus Limnocylindrales bacterium]|nr:signal peptide peptidase SppA [Candidatus Limnocylindrales bacterium]
MTWGKRRVIVVGVVILFFLSIFWALAWRPVSIRSGSVLVIDAAGEINEQRSLDLFAAFNGGGPPVLHDYLDAIDSAAGDSRIAGIVVRIAPLETGWAKLEEIRSHLIAFQTSGKPSICYLGYDGIGNPEYYLASGCSQVWLVPSAPVSIRGMVAETLFMRGTLDKLKIVPEYYHIAEYKTAGNTFTEKKFTPAHKEEVESLLHSVYDRYLTETAKARRMDVPKFQHLVEQGPFLSSDAVADHLVDRLGYWDQVQDYFKQHGRGWNPISLNRYRMSLSAFGGEEIAVVHATGLIVSGDSQDSPTGGFIMGGDSVAADIRDARQDRSIRAIVLRIDSGGGSVVGSEVIRREVELANAVKPVVVSMSDVAASGGYWIASPARKIVADPDTITGSIGVLIGKFNLSGLYGLLGLSTDYVSTSDNATLFSDQQNFTPAQQAAIEKSLQQTYAEFTQGVARGRHMSVEAVDKIAKGRVWSGEQAKQLGLVDELGGMDRAIEVAKQLAGVPAGESVHIVRYPGEKTFWEMLFERQRTMNESVSLHSILRQVAGSMNSLQARVPFDLHIR